MRITVFLSIAISLAFAAPSPREKNLAIKKNEAAVKLVQNGELEAALKIFQLALDLDPTSSGIWFHSIYQSIYSRAPILILFYCIGRILEGFKWTWARPKMLSPHLIEALKLSRKIFCCEKILIV